jgi:Ca2+-binding EF-hand superfamily protein
MRKWTILIGGVGVLGELLLVSDAFPQIGGAPPGGPGGGFRRGGGGGFPRGGLFDRFANGRPSIAISEIPFPPLRQRIEEYAKENGITNGQITRDQFMAAMQKTATMRAPGAGAPGGQGPGGGGPGFPGGGRRGGPRFPLGGPEMLMRVAQGSFQRMDLNHDNFLTPDEVPPALQEELFKYDFDNDGKISPEEYLAYFQEKAKGGQGRGSMEKAPEEEDDGTKRPVVYRAGKLPKELPAWFAQLDKDGDGQISLYEWRIGGRPLEEFARLDRNDDGYLTAEEVLHFEKLAKGKSKGGPPGTETASAVPSLAGPGGMAGPGYGFGGRPPWGGKVRMRRKDGPASD